MALKHGWALLVGSTRQTALWAHEVITPRFISVVLEFLLSFCHLLIPDVFGAWNQHIVHVLHNSSQHIRIVLVLGGNFELFDDQPEPSWSSLHELFVAHSAIRGAQLRLQELQEELAAESGTYNSGEPEVIQDPLKMMETRLKRAYKE